MPLHSMDGTHTFISLANRLWEESVTLMPVTPIDIVEKLQQQRVKGVQLRFEILIVTVRSSSVRPSEYNI